MGCEHTRVTTDRRDLFWQNVVRESLMALAVAAGSGGRLSPTPTGAANSPGPIDDMFDGRMAVITSLGQRIPIADIYPVFACSVATGSTHDRLVSADVQCTVFQIKTPSGEAYTIPLSQIVAVHSLSEELVSALEEQARQAGHAARGKALASEAPFGFAAFTSLARGEEEADGIDPQTPGTRS